MLHPLLTSVYCPFNLLGSFKDDLVKDASRPVYFMSNSCAFSAKHIRGFTVQIKHGLL